MYGSEVGVGPPTAAVGFFSAGMACLLRFISTDGEEGKAGQVAETVDNQYYIQAGQPDVSCDIFLLNVIFNTDVSDSQRHGLFKKLLVITCRKTALP